MPFAQYAWMGGLVAYCLLRIIILRKRLNGPVSSDQIPALLHRTTAISIIVVTILGFAGGFAFITGTFSFELMVPISLAFGTTAIAQCLYTLRFAGVASLLLGITPVASVLLFTGSFNDQMLGAAMLSIEILMIRFVLQQFDVLVERISIEQKFRTFANTDVLTEIANRRAVMAELKLMIECREPFTIVLLDLDDFKRINDDLGHSTGDRVLQHVARRLSNAIQPDDTVGRLGGDEFVAIFRSASDSDTLSMRTTAILAHLCQPIDTGEHIVPVGASLGYASYPDEATTLTGLLHQADMALYAQKRENDAGADSDDLRKIA